MQTAVNGTPPQLSFLTSSVERNAILEQYRPKMRALADDIGQAALLMFRQEMAAAMLGGATLAIPAQKACCTAPGCTKPQRAKDLCSAHYQKARRDGLKAKSNKGKR